LSLSVQWWTTFVGGARSVRWDRSVRSASPSGPIGERGKERQVPVWFRQKIQALLRENKKTVIFLPVAWTCVHRSYGTGVCLGRVRGGEWVISMAILDRAALGLRLCSLIAASRARFLNNFSGCA